MDTYRSRRRLDSKGEGGQAEEERRLSAPVLKRNRVDLNWNKVNFLVAKQRLIRWSATPKQLV